MTTRTFALTACLVTVFVMAAHARQQPTPAAAQTPAPAARATPPPAAAAPEPRRFGQALNVKVDVTLTEQRGTAAPTKKSVTLVVADSQFGAIRSQSDVFAVANQMPLNIDAEPTVINAGPDGGKIRLRLNVQYDLPSPLDT